MWPCYEEEWLTPVSESIEYKIMKDFSERYI